MPNVSETGSAAVLGSCNPIGELERNIDVKSVLEDLTPEQREVCNEILSGTPLKIICELRGISYKQFRRTLLNPIRRIFSRNGMREYLNRNEF